MSATDFIWGGLPIFGADWTVKNTSGTAMTSGQTVKLDASNPLSAAQPAPGVVLTAAVTDYPLGVLIENIPVASYGRCRVEGGAVAIAAGAISAGAIVGPSGAISGDVTTYTAGDPSLGQALSVALNAADPIAVRIAISKNA
jgi:hypothetical protein